MNSDCKRSGMAFFCNLCLLLSLVLVLNAGAPAASADDSIKESFINIWDKVSDAAVKGSKVVKDKSVEIGEDVSDKAVEAWEWANDDGTSDPELEDDAFGDDPTAPGMDAGPMGEDGMDFGADTGDPHVDPEDDTHVDPEDDSLSGKVEKSAAELWSQVARAFSSVDKAVASYPTPAELWDKVNDDLELIAQRLQQQEELPESSLFGADRESNQKKINQLMNQVLEVLEVSDVSRRKQEYAELEEEILQKNIEVAEYREKLVLAPEKVSGVDAVWKDTRADYQHKVDAGLEDIKQLKKRQREILETIKAELFKRSGIELSDEQVYSLVVLVSGDTFVNLNSIFFNIRQLVGVLEQLAEKNRDYVNSVKKYYGMYAVLIGVFKLAHENEIARIQEEYIPRLTEFQQRARSASTETRKLLQKNSDNPANVAMLKNNLRAQAEVYQAAGAYRKYLQGYLRTLERSVAEISRQELVVNDTWKTTELASSLLSVMRSSSAGLKNLVSMELPSIKPLNIGRLKDQFNLISLRIRE